MTLPVFVFAQEGESGGIIPCGQNGPDCDFNDLLELGQNILRLLVVLSIPAAVIAFSYAGFLFLTAGGNSGQISRAKGVFWNVLIGFIVILSAWLIVFTISSVLFSEVPTGFQYLE